LAILQLNGNAGLPEEDELEELLEDELVVDELSDDEDEPLQPANRPAAIKTAWISTALI
jgi:hypothetical protein